MTNCELKTRFAAFREGLEELVSDISAGDRLEGWSDDLLMEMRRGVKFPEVSFDRRNLKYILTRFYHLYFYGTINKMDSIVGVVSDVISIGQTFKGHMWIKNDFSPQGFYKAPESCADTLEICDQSEPLQLNLNTISSEKARKQYIECSTTYTIVDVTLFRNLVKDRIAQIKTDLQTDSEIQLIRLSFFLALTMWRALNMDKYQLNHAFLNIQYRENLNTLAGWSDELPFAPPCIQCMEHCIVSLRKGLFTTSSMFILLVSEYVKSFKSNYCDTMISDILSAAVLNHTSKDGLCVIQLLERASTATNQTWIEISRYSYTNLTADSWDLIKIFFSTYLKKDQLQYSYNWARIINDKYLRGYSHDDMLHLSGILSGIIEEYEGEEIWDVEWPKDNKKEFNQMRMYGAIIYDVIRPTLYNMVVLDAARQVLVRAKALNEF